MSEQSTQPTPSPAAKRAILRTIRGKVTSSKGHKTIRVEVAFQTRHPKYGKFLKRQSVMAAHDEKNEAREGDVVDIAECRPISKTKHHRLIRVVEKAPEKVTHVSDAGDSSASAAQG